MRIDGFNAATEIVTEQSTEQVSSKAGGGAGLRDGDDRTTLAADSVSISSLAAKALDAPAMRQGRIDALRQAVSGGQYQIDPSKIAASMVDESA